MNTRAIYLLLLVLTVCQAKAQDDKYTSEELISDYYDHDFRPFAQRNWFVVGSFSVTDKQQQNDTRLFETVLSGDGFNYDVTLKGGYFIGNYAAVGMRFDYAQDRFEGLVYQDPDTLNRNSISRAASFAPLLITYFPLTDNQRLSFFNELGLGFGFGGGLSRTTKNVDEITKTRSEDFTFTVGLSPGITFFAIENFAFEIQLNVLGYELKVTETIKNDEELSKVITNNVNFNIDILSLDLGLAYYF